MIWNETMECMNPDQRHEIQSQRLRATVDKVYTKVPFYRAKMQEAGVAPSDIKEIEDIVKLPFTTKQDLLIPLTSVPHLKVSLPGFTHRPELPENLPLFPIHKKTWIHLPIARQERFAARAELLKM